MAMDDLRAQITKEREAQALEHSRSQALLREKAKETINTCAVIAALVGVVPIPFSDSPLIVITQLVMLKKLTGSYGRSLGFSLVLILLSAMIGPEIFKALLKLIPVLGSIVGALVAGTCTWLVGRTALGVLEAGQPFTLRNLKAALADVFKEE